VSTRLTLDAAFDFGLVSSSVTPAAAKTPPTMKLTLEKVRYVV
jgi:hypothetical protein